MAGEPLTNVGKTLGGMVTRLTSELGNRTDIPPELIKEYINDSYIDIATSMKLPVLSTSTGFYTSVGEESYTLPPDVGTIHRVAWYSDSDPDAGRLLSKMDADAYRKLAEQAGPPSMVFRIGDILVLWPTPDAVYGISVDFTAKIRKLVNGTDSPIIDEEFHEAIVYGAKARALELVKDYNGSAIASNMMTRILRRKLDKEALEDEGKTAQLVPVRKRSQLTRRYANPYDEDRG